MTACAVEAVRGRESSLYRNLKIDCLEKWRPQHPEPRLAPGRNSVNGLTDTARRHLPGERSAPRSRPVSPQVAKRPFSAEPDPLRLQRQHRPLEDKRWTVSKSSQLGQAQPWTSLKSWTSRAAQMVKNLPATQETQVRALGREDPLQKGMDTHASVLAWRIPWTGEPGGL